MNWDRVQGTWKEMKGKVRERWGKLEDSDLEVAAGMRDRLLGRLQARYGQARDKIEQELDEFIAAL